MRVVAIYPAFVPTMNEMAMTWQRLAELGAVDCRVIAGADDVLKALRSDSGTERLPNLEILRVPGLLGPGRVDDAALAWAAAFEPEVVFCALSLNLGHARRVVRRWRAPILLHVESWRNMIMRRRLYLGIEPLHSLVDYAIRRWSCRHVQAVAYSNPREIASLHGRRRMYYLPWPRAHFPAAPTAEREARALDTIIHIGFLTRWKGAERLGEYGERLLREDSESKLVVVGPAGDKVARKALERLAPWRADGRFRHIERLPRAEAMQLIGRSLAVISPHHATGWGLINDAWSEGTPIIAAACHYELEDGRNALVATSPHRFVEAVRRLRRDPYLWNTLSKEGQRTVKEKHAIDVVASKLLEILRATRGRFEADTSNHPRCGIAAKNGRCAE